MITPMEVLSPLPVCVERRIDAGLLNFHKFGGEVTVDLDDFVIEMSAGLVEEIRRHYEAAGWKVHTAARFMTFRL